MGIGSARVGTTTRERILDAAERLFAEKGFEATSLRSITQEAGVNLAAVHYHFGSKERLIRAVLERRLAPITEERLRRLREAEERPGGASLAQVVEAFVAPLLRLRDLGEKGALFVRLMGRVMAETDEAHPGILRPYFHQTREAFLEAFRRELPHLDEEELVWRLHFVIGAVAHAMVCQPLAGRREGPATRGLCPLSTEEMVEWLVAFLVGGLKAPGHAGRPRPAREATEAPAGSDERRHRGGDA
jgi:AcrR family transcriptional regulator